MEQWKNAPSEGPGIHYFRCFGVNLESSVYVLEGLEGSCFTPYGYNPHGAVHVWDGLGGICLHVL